MIIIIFLLFFFGLLKIKVYVPSKIDDNFFNNDSINNKKEFNLIDIEKRISELKRDSIIWPLPSYIIYKPIMTGRDTKAFSSFMKPENIYFEFGSGGSTNLASYYKLKKIYSVESDVSWHNKLKSHLLNDITYLTIDLNSRDNLGRPGPGTTVEDWKKYIQAYKPEYNADIIFIDGRFRVACGLDIFQKIRADTLVLIHDYNNRPYYHILENYYIKVRSWHSLAAFFKRPNITFIPENVYNEYIHIYKN